VTSSEYAAGRGLRQRRCSRNRSRRSACPDAHNRRKPGNSAARPLGPLPHGPRAAVKPFTACLDAAEADRKGTGHVQVDGPDVDQRATPASGPEMSYGRQRAMHDAPIVGPEDQVVLVERDRFKSVVDPHACIVHPGVEPSEPSIGGLCCGGYRVWVAHACDPVVGLAAATPDPFADCGQASLASLEKHDSGAPLRRAPGDRQAASRSRASDDQGWALRGFNLLDIAPLTRGCPGYSPLSGADPSIGRLEPSTTRVIAQADRGGAATFA